MLWPFECQSGMDVVKVRQQYGHDLIIMGGIDKRTLDPRRRGHAHGRWTA